MEQDYGQQYKLSQFINVVRNYLLEQDFFEHHLYSTLNYKIENTDTFKLKNDLYLRYNPEPDIWQIRLKHDKFFWIGSMFRDERNLSVFHRNEFTVVDIYQSKQTINDVVNKFFELLKILEEKLQLLPLSKLEVKYTTYKEFAAEKDFDGRYWMVVTDYPVEESFYDERGVDNSYAQKFEIFFVDNSKCVEIVACGKLGENLNKINFIAGKENFMNKNLLEKEFTGFGFGLERLMIIYNK